MNLPEVSFNVNDIVMVRDSRRMGIVLVPQMRSQPENALVVFEKGERVLIPITQLERAPDGAIAGA